jgi:hypothetical protein
MFAYYNDCAGRSKNHTQVAGVAHPAHEAPAFLPQGFPEIGRGAGFYMFYVLRRQHDKHYAPAG